MVVLIVVLAIVVVLVGGVLAYNGLVRRRNRTQEAWAQIDVELKRRHDLIPNLVETVKGYAAHERGTFEAVTAARAAAVGAGATGDPAKIAPAENVLTQSLRSLFAVAENYPQLRAVESFVQLQEQLTATEDKIAFARRYYNTSVRDYNIALQTFPRNLLAGAFGFHPVAFFEADEADRTVPEVQLHRSRQPGRPHRRAEPEAPCTSRSPGNKRRSVDLRLLVLRGLAGHRRPGRAARRRRRAARPPTASSSGTGALVAGMVIAGALALAASGSPCASGTAWCWRCRAPTPPTRSATPACTTSWRRSPSARASPSRRST